MSPIHKINMSKAQMELWTSSLNENKNEKINQTVGVTGRIE